MNEIFTNHIFVTYLAVSYLVAMAHFFQRVEMFFDITEHEFDVTDYIWIIPTVVFWPLTQLLVIFYMMFSDKEEDS